MIRPFSIGRVACAMRDTNMTVISMVGEPIQTNPEVPKTGCTEPCGSVSVACRASLAPGRRAGMLAKNMIALEVSLNGKRICTAGAEDLAVLNAVVTACGRLGRKTAPARPDETESDLFYSVGGLTGRKNPKKDVHLRWKSVSKLNVGDVVQVRILETNNVTKPKHREPA